MAEQVQFPVQFALPLSGAVNQAFQIAPQFGLFNVQLGTSGDAALERRIVETVGSYGRQIGRITEVLEILVRRGKLLDEPGLTHAERAAIHDFLGQAEAVAALKPAKAGRA